MSERRTERAQLQRADRTDDAATERADAERIAALWVGRMTADALSADWAATQRVIVPTVQRGMYALDAQTFDYLTATDAETARALWDDAQRQTDAARRATPIVKSLETGSVTVLLGAGMRAPVNYGAAEHWRAPSDVTSDAQRVTDSADDAATGASETFRLAEWSGMSDDGQRVMCVCVARLQTGAAEYIGAAHTGIADGPTENYRTLRTEARNAARNAARADRRDKRRTRETIGSDAPTRYYGPRSGFRPVETAWGFCDSETYARLRIAVSTRARGNDAAATQRRADAGQRVSYRAGIRASGMPLDVDLVDDATQNAALLLQRMATRGLSAGLDAWLDDMDADGPTRLSVCIAAAARDGIRYVTRQRTATQLARAVSDYGTLRASYRNAKDSDAPVSNTEARAALQDKLTARTTERAQIMRATGGQDWEARSGYVGTESDSARTDALLARLSHRSSQVIGTGADARRVMVPTYPALLALFLADGQVEDAALSLGARTSVQNGRTRIMRTDRDRFVSQARAEWDALAPGRTAALSAEWVDLVSAR